MIRLVLLLTLAAGPAWADYELCEQAIAVAERAAKLPPKLFGAIARAESGRADATGRVRPWPWTINLDGVGVFFPTKEVAVGAVALLRLGRPRSIDVGCMQINLAYHPNAFATLEDAFDPATNAAYAARFLTSLHAKFPQWPLAVAAYHSQDPEKGEAYQKLVYGRVMISQVQQAVVPNVVGAKLPNPAFGAFLPQEALFGAFARR